MGSRTPGGNECLAGQNDRKGKGEMILFQGDDMDFVRTAGRKPVIQDKGRAGPAAGTAKHCLGRFAAAVLAKQQHCQKSAEPGCLLLLCRKSGDTGKDITGLSGESVEYVMN